jgi:hypothetical protein
MEDSILISTKKILNVGESYDAFDLDILTHMNMVFSTLNQIGVGPTVPVVVEDDSAVWSSLDFPPEQLAMVKTYVFLKVRLLFDPPGTSFVIEAMNKQISELEWRLNFFREVAIDGI